MKNNLTHFYVHSALYFFLITFSIVSEANFCLNLFSDSVKVERADVELLYSKSEIEALFRIRHRLKASQNGTARILNSAEAGIMSRITGQDVAPWKLVRRSDFDSQVILKAFQGLAFDLAWKAHQRYPKVPLEDLRQAAMIGLWEAVETYQADSIYMFSSIATKLIKGSLSETLAALAYPVATHARAHTMMGRISHFQADLRKEFGREPTVEEIVVAHNKKYSLQISKETVLAFMKWRKFLNIGIVDATEKRMNRDVENPDQYEVDLADQIKDPRPNPEELAHFKSVQSKLAQALYEVKFSHLRNIEAVLHLYGIVLTGDFRNPGLALTSSKTLESVAAEMPREQGEGNGITRERLRQMELKGLRLVRLYLKNKFPRDFEEIDLFLQAIIEIKPDLLKD